VLCVACCSIFGVSSAASAASNSPTAGEMSQLELGGDIQNLQDDMTDLRSKMGDLDSKVEKMSANLEAKMGQVLSALQYY
jgi:uncharacterized protein YlxW (UPF0749 family)